MSDERSLAYLRLIKQKHGLQPPIINVGAGNPVEQRAYLSAYEGFEHTNLDIQASEGIDIIADVCNMPEVLSNTYGTIICLDTLEHIAYPFAAMKEMFRILKPEGLLILSTAMAYAIHRWSILHDDKGHGRSHFCDYWRFCPDGLKLLFQDMGFQLLELRLDGKTFNENLAELPIGEGADEQSGTYIFATGRKP